MRLVEDNPSSLSLLDVFRQRCERRGIEHDSPVAKYYDRLVAVQSRGSQASHQVLRDILKDVQTNMVPRATLKEWAAQTFKTATDYWTFRKMFTLQLALIGFAEYVLHLTRLNPDMMYIHRDSGLINVAYFKFDVDDVSGDMDANQPIPFRLTPNISEFISSVGVAGPFTASMIAVARCFSQPNFKFISVLRAILRDEMITWHKKKQEDRDTTMGQSNEMKSEVLVSMVAKAITAISSRLNSLAAYDMAEGKGQSKSNSSQVAMLVAAANSVDNLCRMDPAWHPWL